MIFSMRRAGQSSFYHSDALGSTVQLTDSNQNVTDSYVYSAFGEEKAVSGNTINPVRFVGRHNYRTDQQSGLKLLGVRYYRATEGRFLSPDPSREGRNWYLYVSANAVNRIDPTGLACRKCYGSEICKCCSALVSVPACVAEKNTKCDGAAPVNVTRLGPCQPTKLDLQGCKCILSQLHSMYRNALRYCTLSGDPLGLTLPPGLLGAPLPPAAEIAFTLCCEENDKKCSGRTYYCKRFTAPCTGTPGAGSIRGAECVQHCWEYHEFVHRGQCRACDDSNVTPVPSKDRMECLAYKDSYICLSTRYDQGRCSEIHET